MVLYFVVFLLFSLLMCGSSIANKTEPPASSEGSFSEDQEEGNAEFVKRDLIIITMSAQLVVISIILMCCCFFQYKLVTQEEKILKKEEVQAFALQTHSLCEEICIVLSPEHTAPSRVTPLQPSQSEISAMQSLLSGLTSPASRDSASFGYKSRPWSNSNADPTERTQALPTCMSTLSNSTTHLQQHEDYCMCSSSSPASESTEVCTCEDRETNGDSAGAIFCPTTSSSKGYADAN